MNIELYLCRPEFLRREATYSPWMAAAQEFSVEKALQQHDVLVQTLEALVPGQVRFIPPREGLNELCFVGDSLFAIDKKAVFSRFSVPDRFPETEYAMEAFRRLGFSGERVPVDVCYEGSGETLLLGDTILVGYGIRSQASVVPLLEKIFARKIVAVELIDARFYHLDTALLLLRNNLAICYPAALSATGRSALEQLDCEIIYLDETELEPCCLNAIVLNDNVVIDAGAKKMGDRLEKLNFNVHPVDTSEFIKFGASVKCLTFQHYVS